MANARRRGVGKLRISGGEPTLGKDHQHKVEEQERNNKIFGGENAAGVLNRVRGLSRQIGEQVCLESTSQAD